MGATYPLVVLSTRESVDTHDPAQAKKSILAALETIRKEKGLGALYSGIGPCLFAISVTNGLYYFFYENMRGVILKRRGGTKALSTVESLLAGLVAGLSTSFFSNPVWVLQTTQIKQDASSEPSRLGVLETIRALWKADGIKAFGRGLGPAMFLAVNPIIQYTVFEQMKNFLIKSRTAKLRATGGLATAVAVLTDWDYFLLGALSKLVATGLTYPCIVVKNRLQAGSKRYKSLLYGVMTIAKEEGVEGLYKGISSKLLQSVLTAAILFASQKRIYELVKQALTAAPVLAK